MQILEVVGAAALLLIFAFFYFRGRTVSLKSELSRAKELGIWLHSQSNDIDLENADWKHQMGFALFQQSLDIDDGIIILLENNLPGPALALARSRFEAYVRGLWLLNFASDPDVERFQRADHLNFNFFMERIGSDAETGGAWIKANADANLKDFHDLTHGGMSHVRRRINNSVIEPGYPKEELISLIRFGLEIKIRIGVEILAWMKNESALDQLNQRAVAIRNAP